MKQTLKLGFFYLITLLMSCGKIDDANTNQEPIIDNALLVNTLPAKGIACNNAQLIGEIKTGTNFEEKGAVISTHEGTTIADTKLKDATTSANISVVASGLAPETKYFYRAYIIKGGVPTYGNEGFFITPKCDGNNNTILDTNFYCDLTYDGTTYKISYSGINFAPFINPNYTHNSNADPIAGFYMNVANTGFTQFVFSKASGSEAGFVMNINELVTQGTYVINSSNHDSGDRDVSATKNLANINDALAYDFQSRTRSKNSSGTCIESPATIKGSLTLNITSVTEISVPTLAFAFPTDKMNIYVGNFSGTLYENAQTDINCQNSRAVQYSCTFRMPCPVY